MKDEPTYEGLARRYRPATFADVVGQRHIVQTLQRAVAEKRWAPAYLFIGGRGLGKTTMARLLAKAVNCEKGPTDSPCMKCGSCVDIAGGRDLDVLEIDAASNTGVDNVRDVIIQSVGTSAVRGYAKVFIIDEVHMLSAAAFNALLKTIEEPPSRVIFILATTEGHKVPSTIRSRCQRFDFRPVTVGELGDRLVEIAKKEKIRIDRPAVDLICDYAEGGVRDALSALDLVAAFSRDRIDAGVVEDALGLIPHVAIDELMRLFEEGEAEAVFAALNRLFHSGGDSYEIMRGLMNAFRRELHAEFGARDATERRFSRGRIVASIEAIIATMDRSRYARHPQLELEILLSRLTAMADEEITLKEIYARLTTDAPTSPVVRAAPPGKAKSRPEVARPAVTGDSPERLAVPQSTANPCETAMIAARGISSMAGALLADAELVPLGDNRYRLDFAHDFHMNRYRKEEPLQAEVMKAICGSLGIGVTLEIARRDGATTKAPSPQIEHRVEPLGAPRAGSPRQSRNPESAERDQEIEKIKEIFKVDVVEVIDNE